ncbi:nitroreductase NfnB [Arthrobacter sp. StoSoilA2]|uniref:nitroreductase family protein n=1 Tax=Arthrobacter sp. StoSoilA2 TaxID=2830990 RepID=UPI001CC5BF00|nr:nitroreductase family protein [Arthrobacter sp. StoSoilA2]BCW35939.1 nitroreductase NfnB [Arthrobacter sp. StoSoilA2]
MTSDLTAGQVDRSHPVPSETSLASSFQALVRERRSCRSFLSKPVDELTLRETLADAVWAPSNCNTQPWEVHVVSGPARDRLIAAVVEAEATDALSPDFSFDGAAYTGPFGLRRQAQGASYHEALGIDRRDYQKRRSVSAQNLYLHGAPHVAFLFMPEVGDSVRVASDVGMFAQTFLLALTARGLAGVPQTSVGMFADTIRRELGVSAESKLLFGISFGWPDKSAAAYSYSSTREPLESFVTLHHQ